MITDPDNWIAPLFSLEHILMCSVCNLSVLPEGPCLESCRHVAACSYSMYVWLHKEKINLVQPGHSSGLCFNSLIYFPEPLQERELAKAQTWKNESSVYWSLKGTDWRWYLYSLLKPFSGLDYLLMWFLVSDSHWVYQYSHIRKLRASRLTAGRAYLLLLIRRWWSPHAFLMKTGS